MDIAEIVKDIPGGFGAWRDALEDWRLGVPAPLAALMREHPTPDWVAKPLADFLEGKGPAPESKGKGRAKYSPSAKRRAVAEWLPLDEALANLRADLQGFADDQRIEPAEARARIAATARNILEAIADQNGVSPATVEQAAKQIRRARKQKGFVS